MRNYTNHTIILFLLLSFSGFSQVDPNLLSLKNRKIENPLGEPKSNPKQNTLSDALIDTNGYSVKPMRMTTKGNKKVQKEELNVIDDVVLAVGDAVVAVGKVAIDGWDKVFIEDQKKAKVQHNAFYITVDTTVDLEFEKKMAEARKREDAKFKDNLKNIVNESSKGFNDVLVIENPVKVEEPKITVMFKDGKLVPIEKDSIAEVGKSVVEKVFKMDVDDDEWLKTPTFEYAGETYTKMTKKEIESLEYKATKTRSHKVYKAKRKDPNVQLNLSIVPKQKIKSVEHALDLYEDAINAGEKYGVPAAITAAQFILESRAGRSKMAVEINNLFGIKCGGGKCSVRGCSHGLYDDDHIGESFVRYPNYEASFAGHIKFFLKHKRYQPCIECGVNDIPCWLFRLKLSLYATDVDYDRKLAQIIERYKLTDERIHYNRKEVRERLSLKK